MLTLYCGDPHGRFEHINRSAIDLHAATVVLLGDMEPARPLEEELLPLLSADVEVWWIPGNHDADSDGLWQRVWGSKLADCNVHGRVASMRNGQRLAGLGGVFREAVWYPQPAAARGGAPAFRTRDAHADSTPRQDRWNGGHHRKHWGTIYPAEVDSLADLQADVLVTHEAPGYHPTAGFDVLDALAQAMGVKVAVHGHQHDALDSSKHWQKQGFKTYGVGLRGITAIDAEGNASVIVPGELDSVRAARAKASL
jgi:predicted phosphodiesterase